MSFKGAFGWSVMIHMGLLMVRPTGLVPPRETLHTIEITYLPIEQPLVPKPASQPQSPKPAKLLQPEALPLPKKLFQEISPSPPAQHPSMPPRPLPKPVLQERPSFSPPISSGVALNIPETEFAQVKYKQQVREHLKRHLRYPPILIQGTVRLRVFIASDGFLKEAVVLEATDPRLAAACLADVRSASSFPRFPKEVKLAQANYDFLVQYRPE